MKISEDLRKKFVRELRFCSQNMMEEKNIRKKIFFYSAAYGMARRVMNLEFDPQIQMIESILEFSYQIINVRIKILTSGDTTIPIVEGMLDKLTEAVYELSIRIEKDQDTYETLQKISNYAFITTGNGYYLYTKGLVQI